LTKAVKPKLTFWCLQGFFPEFLKKEAHCCLEQSGEGDAHPELFGKGEGEAEDWWKREFPGSMHEGLLVTTAAGLGSTGALEARGDLHSQVTGMVKTV
jgi:hypothetical protein